MGRRSVHLGMALIACSFSAWAAPLLAATGSTRQTLPDTIDPVAYDLAIVPDTDALRFQGKVAIVIDVHRTTPTVVINAVHLALDHATIDGGKEASVTQIENLGRVVLDFDAPLSVGQHVLSIAYHGNIGRSTLGFFAMDYSNAAGRHRILATNFEPAAAREFLPCWDEPGRKATFAVTVETPKDLMAVSNMPIEDVTPLSSTMQRVRFAKSPRMSTYLLFLGVGDFERVHHSVDGVELGVVVQRGDTARGTYALDQAEKILHFYNEYFGVTFPLPKLDLIVAPGEIKGGSMENWGAIFFSQRHLLVDPANSTQQDRELVFEVISHEMAHQWFGDLVTMSWWDDLWLNEGFASWMENVAADALHPQWNIGLRALSDFDRGREADAVPSTHPVVQEIFTAEQAEQAFDEITYLKGAAVLAMMDAYIGGGVFREGLGRYMNKYAYGNAVDVDLWRTMEEASGKPVLGIERDFTHYEGVPLVRVTRTSMGTQLQQERFADNPETIRELPQRLWHIPLTIRELGGAKKEIVLEDAADIKSHLAMLVNAGQTAYTRVLYDASTFQSLTMHLGELGPADQLGLLNDAFALGTAAGYASASNLLRLCALLPVSADPVVWQRVIDLLMLLERHYQQTPQRSAFHRFALELLAPLAVRLGPVGVPDEASNVEILRSALVEAQGRFGDAPTIERARKIIDGAEQTSAAQWRSALVIVANRANFATFDSLLKRARDSKDLLEKQRIYEALAGVEEPVLARRMLNIALSDEVPAGTAHSLLWRLARYHPDLAWQVIAPRLSDPKLPFSTAERWRLAQSVAEFSSLPDRIADVEAYEAKNVPADSRKPFLEVIASIRKNQRIASIVLPDIDRWIASRSTPANTH